jgi:hypothetical protein
MTSHQILHQARNTETNTMDQDFHAERLEQRDIFFNEREVYDDETSYLLRTWIIFFLRRVPRPGLKRDITAKLVEIHDQPVERFLIKPAIIALFLIVCPADILKDMVVRRCVYQLLELGVEFRVSEWRPRFGLAYDPPTHQAWVILRGAPLQLWTRPDVAQMV